MYLWLGLDSLCGSSEFAAIVTVTLSEMESDQHKSAAYSTGSRLGIANRPAVVVVVVLRVQIVAVRADLVAIAKLYYLPATAFCKSAGTGNAVAEAEEGSNASELRDSTRR
jgi:hypothetical protein